MKLSVLGATWLMLASAFNAIATCQALPEEKIKQLTSFVQEQYRLNFELTVLPSDISLVEDTCYRKIRFTSIDREQHFGLSLYLSPDYRFLSRELIDSTIDPIAREQAEGGTILAKLRSEIAPILGPNSAAVTITLFSDFQCPFCKEQAKILREEVLPSEPGVRLIFRHMPLSFHPWSEAASEAAACAAVQSNEAFWAVHDFIFQHQRDLTSSTVDETITAHVGSLPLVSKDKFKTCMAHGRSKEIVDRDRALARELGIEATPSLFVNAFRVNGVASAEQLHTLIRQIEARNAVRPAATRGHSQ